MDFKNEKKQFLGKPDKSLAQGIDKAILPLCRKINKNPDYYTTSSCAGRIILIKEKGKKQENAFIKIWHDKILLEDLMNELKNAKYDGMIYLRHEPCIMHVSCKSLDDAEKLVQLARHSGWKKSGIISLGRNIIEIVSTEILATPIMNKRKILVDKDYISILVKEANKKLKQTREKIKNLENNLK
jgi:tRNA wybutosine-synthesizing protein 3